MSFLSPLAFIGLLLAVPILLLYMLRLRRQEQVISSTFLWRQVIQDQEANTPWQRLRRNLLLILQLIILALLILALARPFSLVPAVSAARVAIILDASASMTATDGGDGRTRFEAGQEAALALLDALSADSEVSVLHAAATPTILAPYSSNLTAAYDAVRAARPSAGEADWSAALTLASAGALGDGSFTMVLITDGGVTDGIDLSILPGDIRHIPVGTASDNVALSALATRILPDGTPQLFAQITNTGVSEAEVVLTLRADDDPLPLVSERYTIPAGASLPITSSAALPDGVSVLSASITPTINSLSRDALALDNTAYTRVAEPTDRTILLVTEDNLFLEQVLATLPGVRAFKAPPGRPLPAQRFDLTIFDRVSPVDGVLPEGAALFIAPPESVAGVFSLGEETGAVGRLTAAVGDPRLTFVDLSAVSVLKYRPLVGADWADVLVSSDGAPLVVAGERGGRRVGVFAFALNDSDLPLQIAFPVLMANLMDWFIPSGILAESTVRVGQAQAIRPRLDAETVRVTAPDGSVSELTVAGGSVLYSDTAQPGIYRVEVVAGGEIVQAEAFTVNLFSPSESDITPRPVADGRGGSVSRDLTDEPGQYEFWPLLALLALFVLIAEWYLYHRRQQARVVPFSPQKQRARG